MKFLHKLGIISTIGILATLSIGVFRLLDTADANNQKNTAKLLPAGVLPARFNMLRADIVKQNKHLNPKPDEEGNLPNILIEEGLKSPFYDTIIYGFGGLDKHLISITFKIERSADYIRKQIPSFVVGVLKKYGYPGKIIVERMKGHDYGSLLWLFGSDTVIASYPLGQLGRERSYGFVIRVFSKETDLNNILNSPKTDEQSKILEVKNDLERFSSMNLEPEDIYH